MSRGVVGGISVGLGLTSWLIGVQLGPGPTPLAAGGRYLLVLGIAGLVLGVVERNLSWTGLGGLYLGQVGGLLVQVFLGYAGHQGEPLIWQPLFILSFMLAGALGGVLGAAVATLARPSRGGTAGAGR